MAIKMARFYINKYKVPGVKTVHSMKILIYSILVLLLIPIVFALYHGPIYTYRVLAWQDSDYDDFVRFSTKPINQGNTTFNFYRGTAKQKEQLESDFQNHAIVGDMKSFMEETGTYAFLVIRNDTILYEEYFNHSERSSIQTSFSTAKSVLSLLVGLALSEKKIDKITDPITKYIPELIEEDERFADITIKHLLTMRSGLSFERGVSFPFVTADEPLTYSHPDLRKVAIKKTEIKTESGVVFLYNDYNALLLGLILERVLGEPVSEYLERKIWKPLGMEYDASWITDENNFEQMQSGLNARAVDFAKLGRLVLHNGFWEGEEIVDSLWISRSSQPRDTLTFRSGQQWAYGYMWWTALRPGLQPDIFACGHMGQFIYISPTSNTVIIRNGLETGPLDDDDWVDLFSSYSKIYTSRKELNSQ